jgi:hypothetical protein
MAALRARLRFRASPKQAVATLRKSQSGPLGEQLKSFVRRV